MTQRAKDKRGHFDCLDAQRHMLSAHYLLIYSDTRDAGGGIFHYHGFDNVTLWAPPSDATLYAGGGCVCEAKLFVTHAGLALWLSAH